MIKQSTAEDAQTSTEHRQKTDRPPQNTTESTQTSNKTPPLPQRQEMGGGGDSFLRELACFKCLFSVHLFLAYIKGEELRGRREFNESKVLLILLPVVVVATAVLLRLVLVLGLC